MLFTDLLKDSRTEWYIKTLFISILTMLIYAILGLMLVLISLLIYGDFQPLDLPFPIAEIIVLPLFLSILHFYIYIIYAFVIVGSVIIKAIFRKIRNLT